MNKDRIRTVLKEEEANLTDIIDMVIEDNGIIGVGKITLAEQLSNYVLYGIFHTIPRPRELKLEETPDFITSEFDKPEDSYEQQ